MLSAQASAFVASAPRAEASMREQLLHAAAACKGRHAHMPGISPISFASGLAMDFAELERTGRALERRLCMAGYVGLRTNRPRIVEPPSHAKLGVERPVRLRR